MSDLVFDATDSARIPTTQRVQPNVRLALSVLLVCAGYYIGALIGKSLRFPSSNLALIWPPTAVLLAGLLLARRRTWWIYLLAAAPVHILVQSQDAVPVWGIMSLLLGNFGQAVLAALSVRYFNQGAPPFDSFRAVVIFMLGAVIVAPVVVSSIAAYLYVLSGWEQSYRYAWGARVLSNALSTLMIVPPIILLASRRATAKTAPAPPQRYVESGLLIVAVVLTGWISFSKQGEALFGMACPIILPLPVLLWSAVRFRLEGLCLCFLLVAYVAFLHASGDHGFLAINSPAQTVFSLQLYLILIALPLMMLAVLVEERQAKEQAIREAEARYRALVMAGAEMVWRANAQGEGIFITPTWQNLTGQNEEQMRDFGWLEAVHPDDRERSNRLWKQAVHDRHAYETELRVRTREGNYRHFHIQAVPVIAPDGSVYEWVGANRDITDRKRAEDALKDALDEVRRLKERLELENVYLRSEVMGAHRHGEILGESEGIRKVLEQVEQVAITDMTVLVLGETGTGKELVARLVYEKSGRRERPLVKVNCSALPAELIESELFGHERGAFTGAVAKQVGRFELADGGTIFLDEVGELPLGLQSKLLTVLQEGEFERLGSGKTIKVDVRVIAATNRNLIEAVQQGRFRSDLYYRLNVYPIEIPPLRERREDIGLLAEAFLQEGGRRLGKSFGKIPGEVIEALQGYSWPGNVRELENVIGRAAVTSTGLTLQLPDGWNQASGPRDWVLTLPRCYQNHSCPIKKKIHNRCSRWSNSNERASLRSCNKRIGGLRGRGERHLSWDCIPIRYALG